MRQVPLEEGKAFAESNGLAFLETSALDTTNVDEAFTYVIKEAFVNMGRKTLDTKGNAKNGVVLGPSQSIPQKKAASKPAPSSNSGCGCG